VLLVPGAGGNWLHDSVGRALLGISGALHLGTPLEDWRILFLLGGAPVVLVFLVRFGVRETRRFSAERSTEESPRRGFVQEIRAHLQNARKPWQQPYRGRMIIVVLLWNCVHLVTAPAVAFWVIYAKEDLLLTPHQVGQILFLGYAGGFVGSFVAGFLIDWIGRKRICAVFYVLASVAIFMLFQTRTLAEQYVWMILTVSVFGVANSATNIYSSELFPTAIRATGYAWATMVFGRATEILTPLGIGLFVGSLGISWSVAVFAFGPVIGAIIVMLYAPETKGLTLEEIQEKLAIPQAGALPPSEKGSPARTAAP
jgi:putative MFS transporter